MLAAQSVARVQQSIRERYNQSRKEWGLE